MSSAVIDESHDWTESVVVSELFSLYETFLRSVPQKALLPIRKQSFKRFDWDLRRT